MASLTSCTKKFGEFLRPEDKQAIYAGAKRYRNEGMGANQAGLRAVDDQLDTVRKLLNGFAPAESLAPEPTAPAKPATKTTSEKDVSLIDAVENAKDDAEYKTAIDNLYKQWMDINQEHPEIEAYLDAEIGTKPTQRAFSKEWDESEARVEDANREGKRGLKVGQSGAGTVSTVNKETDNILRGLAMPSVFRATSESSATGMSEQDVSDVVDKTIAGLPGAPRIVVARNPAAAGVPHADGVVPVAGVSDGTIYVFSDQATSPLHVQESVFHELFHYGLRSLLTPKQYHEVMRYLRNTSPAVFNLAEKWKLSADGQTRLKTMTSQDYESLAVEEALAVVSEQINTGAKIGSAQNPIKRQLASWLAKVADMMGMKALAQRIRSASYTEAEAFVQRAVANAGESQAIYDTIKERRAERGEAAPTTTAADTVLRTDGKAAVLPPAIAEASNTISNFIADAAKSGMVKLSFTKDLVRIASKVLPTAQRYVEMMDERGVIKTRYVRKVRSILELFDALTPAQRGTGAGTVNDFIRQSTSSSKWGYSPAHLTGVTVDPDMAVKFKALSAKEQAVVKAVFEHGSTTLADMKAAVVGNITSDYDLLISEAKAAGDTIELASLEKKKVSSLKDYVDLMALNDGQPYAPLKRFGNFVVVGRSQRLVDAVKAEDTETIKKLELDGAHYFVEFAETMGEARAIKRENDSKYASVEPFKKDTEAARMMGGRDVLGAFYRLRTIASDTDNGADGPASKAVNRMVNDLHLMLLTEQSARHAERKRKNIAGADKDMMRAFETQGQATAQFIASLHNNAAIYEQLLAMKKEADSIKPGRAERRSYYNEFMQRHAMGLDYEPSPLADKALAASSAWLLLTNPAYFLQNATQALMMSLPVIAGKHGYGRSLSAFFKAYSDVSAVLRKEGLNEETYAKLPEDVRYAIEKLVDQGSIDISMDQEMGQWKSEKDSKLKHFDSAMTKLKKVATDLEAINRVVTGVAAYRLDKQRGASEADAIKYAAQMIYDTHGDYSGANAPRIMRTPAGRVVTQFRKFQLIQISLMVKLLTQAFKGANAEERAAGRASLAFTLTHMLAVGGTMALPGFAAISWIVGKVWPDDDEPDNPELTLRRAIGDESIADLLLKGVPKLAGVDLSGKLGMGNMLSLLPFADGGLSREGYAENFVALAGPFLGGLLPKVAHGVGLMYNDKEYYKGVEALLPTGLAGALRAGRLLTEGDTTRRGDVTLNAEEISVLDAALSGLGLPTNTLTDKQFLQAAKYETDTFFKERSSRVMKQYTEAYRAGDSEALSEARQEFQDLQEARMRNGYTRQPLSQLLKAPREQAKRESNTAGGVQFRKDNRRFVEETSDL